MTALDQKAHYSVLLGVLAAILFLVSFTTVDAQEIENPVSEIDTELPYTIELLPGGDEALGDFVVGPGKVDLEIRPGEEKTIMLSVSNRMAKTQRFNLEVEDATASQDLTRAVDLLGDGYGPYTLRDYISVSVPSVVLESNTRARIPVTISIPADAEPGGRYGSVLVNTVALEPDRSTAEDVVSQSPIIARIGTLFFITVPGDIERSGALKDFSTLPDQSWFSRGPITFGILYENTGSIHNTPYGTLSITNALEQEVGYVELDPWYAMPKALRLREVTWDNEYLFGRYTATLQLNRGYNGEVDTASVTFWVVPWQFIVATFGIVFVIVFLIRAFFSRFEFRRKV